MSSNEHAAFNRYLVVQLFLAVLIAPTIAQSAERGKPLIKHFSPEDYGGPPQVRDIVQDASGVIYAACDAGVLQYDGTVWRTIPHPDRLPVHSLAIDGNGTIFVGCDGDIGTLRADATGIYRFDSLLKQLPAEHRAFGQVNRLITAPGGVYFLALHHLFRWPADDRGQLRVWTARQEREKYTGEFTCADMVDGQLYVHQSGVGLAVLEGDALELVPGAEPVRDIRLQSVLRFDDSKLLLVTATDGLLLHSEGQTRPFDSRASQFATRHSPTGCMRLPGGLFALSTQKRAVVLFDEIGNIVQLIDTRAGATRNVIGRVFVDQENGLWIPLAHGLARTKIGSPFQYFELNRGLLGDVRAVVRHTDNLLVGTTQGLFVLKSFSTPGRLAWLKPLANGHCRDLLVVQDQVLVAMDRGLFVIEDGKLASVSDRPCSTLVASRDGTTVYVGSDRIDAFSFRADGWTNRGTIASGLNRVVDIFETSDGSLWVRTQDANWIAQLKRVPRSNNDQAGPVKTYGRQHGLNNSRRYFPFLWRDQLFVGTPNGLFQYDASQDRFDAVLPERSNDGRMWFSCASRPRLDSRDRVWFITDKKQVARAAWTNAGPTVVFPFQRALVGHFTSVVPESGGTAVWATTSDERLIKLDESLDGHTVPSILPRISRLSSPQRGTIFGGVFTRSASSPRLPFFKDTLRIEYGFPRFDSHTAHEFQSRLVGLNDQWSGWTRASYQDFAALREGRYRFELRARDGLAESETASLEFHVLPPWYRTLWAYGMYAGVLLATCFGLVRWRVRESNRHMRRLEKQVEERRRAEATLAERLRFEELIAGLSAEFIDVAPTDVGELFDRSLKTIVKFTDVDRVGVFLFSDDMQSVQRAYEQYAAGTSAPPHYLQSGKWHRLDDLEMRWVWDVSKRGQGFALSTLSEFPDEADHDRRLFEQRGTKSLLHAPMNISEVVLGFVYLECVTVERHLSKGFVTQFGLIAQIFANALHRQLAEERRKEQQSVLAHVSRLSTMGEMVAGIAHEITQPLHAISNFAVASTKVLEEDPSERKKKVLNWVQKISAEVDRSGEIIRRLRDFTGNASTDPRMLDLNEVVEESLGIVVAELRQERVTVQTDFDPMLPKTRCDRVQIQQVLVNVLRNAMDAMRDTTDTDRRIQICTHRLDGELHIDVRDRGCGFSPEESAKLFDPFYTTKAEGMGIGLAISRTIMESHNGRVWATGNEQGSTFTVALPVAVDVAESKLTG